MPSPNGRKRRHHARALRTVGKFLDRAGSGLIQWMTTNHNVDATPFLDSPTPGFLGEMRYALKSCLVSVGLTILLVVLYMIWIPFVLWLFYSILFY